MTQASSWKASHRVGGLTFSPDGRHLLVTSSSLGDTLEMFDVETGARVWKRGARTANCGDVTFTPDGRFLVTGRGEGFVLASADARKILRKHDSTEHYGQYAALSPDGTRLVTAVGVTIRVYDVASQAKTFGLRMAFRCDGISFSPDGARVAMLGRDGVHVWDAAFGQQQVTLHPPTVDLMVFGRCGHVLVTAGKGGVVRVWDVATGTQRRQLELGWGTTGISFSPDGRLALASGGGTLRIWDVIAGYERTRLPAPARLRDAALNDGGTRLAMATGRSVVIWQIEDPPAEMIGDPGHAGRCPWCAASQTQVAAVQDVAAAVDAAEPVRSSSGNLSHGRHSAVGNTEPERSISGDLSRGGLWAVDHAKAIATGLVTLVVGACFFGLGTGQLKVAALIAVVPVCLSSFLFSTWNAQLGAPSRGRKTVDVALRVIAVGLLLAVTAWVGGSSPN